jgi:hypothetical protein
MVSKEPKINKQAVAGTTRHITFTIPETLEIIRKPGTATSQSVILAAYKIGLLTIYGIKKHKEKITCKNFGQYRYCLRKATFNHQAQHQFCGSQIK